MPKRAAVKNYPVLPPIDEREVLRYAGVRGETDEGVRSLLAECLQECEGVFSARVVYRQFAREEFFASFPILRESKTLQERLGDSESVVLFAATVGLPIDRLTAKYASLSNAKALFFQAIGAERIEAVCDLFCKGLGEEYKGYPRARCSPGYGDFPLQAQREFFAALDCYRAIGVGLTDSLLMTPTKSVTAVVGFSKEKEECKTGCALCGKTDCQIRKQI